MVHVTNTGVLPVLARLADEEETVCLLGNPALDDHDNDRLGGGHGSGAAAVGTSQHQLLLHGPRATPPTTCTIALSHLSLVAANMFFGCGAVIMKVGLGKYKQDAITFALYREACVAVLLVATACLVHPKQRPRFSDAGRLVATGVSLFGIQFCFILGVAYAGPAVATFWQPALPVVTTVLTIALGMERLTLRKALGILFCVGGALTMVLVDSGSTSTSSHGGTCNSTGNGTSTESLVLLGNGLLFMEIVVNAVYLIVMKPLLKRHPPLCITAWTYLVAAVCMASVAVVRLAVTQDTTPFRMTKALHSPHLVGLLPLVYWVFIGSCAGYSCIAFANQHLDASTMASYSTSQPVYGLALSIPLLHTRLEYKDLGALGIIAGLFIIISRDLLEPKPARERRVHKTPVRRAQEGQTIQSQ